MKFANDACGEGYRYSPLMETCVPDKFVFNDETDNRTPPTQKGGGAWSSENLKNYGSILTDLIGAFRRGPDTPDTIVYQQAPPQKNNTGIWIGVVAIVVLLFFLLKK